MTKTSDTPIMGDVISTEFYEDTFVAQVEDEDGNVWLETYEFVQAETDDIDE
jgi:hypothetical protein